MRQFNSFRRTMVAFRCLLLLLFVLVSSASGTNSNTGLSQRRTNVFEVDETITVRVTPQPRAVDLQTCYYHLLQAAFYDGTVSQSDFITFIQLSSGGTLGYVNQWGINITGFNMLNPEFVGIYNLYACGDALIGCPSIEGIDISGDKLQTTDGSEGLLNSICNDVYGVIDTLNSKAPTQGPIGSGGFSSSPTVGGLSPSPTANSTSEGIGVSSPTTSPSVAGGADATAGPTIGGSNQTLSSPSAPSTASPSVAPVSSQGSSSPTIGTTIAAPSSQESSACPPIYVPNTSYEAFDQVTNPSDESSGKYIYECKDAPYTPWCSQAAYEPGVAMPWKEAWNLVGECDDEVGTGTTPPTDNGTPAEGTNAPVLAATTAAPSTSPESSFTPPSSTPTISSAPSVTVSPTTSTKSPSTSLSAAPTAGLSKSPVVGDNNIIDNPDDSLYTGSLIIDFQYEVGNEIYCNANSIETGEDPTNDMMEVLLNSTNTLVEQVVAETFRRRILDIEGGHGRKLRSGRLLQVSYSTGTLVIDDLEDIFCPSSLPGYYLCQKVFCKVELNLTNEPKSSTELQFKRNIYKAIDDGAMTYPENSGIVYTSSPKTVSVQNPIITPDPERGGETGGGDGDDDGGEGGNSWVVPVSIVGVVFGLGLISLLIGFHVVRSKHKSEAEQAQLSLEGDDLEDDINGPKDKSPLFDVEVGNVIEPHKSRTSGQKNPFFESVSSSSGGSSSSASTSNEDLDERKQRVIDTSKLDQLNDQLKDFTASGESLQSTKSMYRAGVEALLKESCPDEVENLDELMAEYEGREEELIGQLSSLLANMNRSSDIGLQEEEDDDEEDGDGSALSSVTSMTPPQEEVVPEGYYEVQGQIEGALAGKASPSAEEESEEAKKKKAAAAAAATLFTGASTKGGLGADWSSDSDDSDNSDSSSGSDSNSSSEGSSEWSTDDGLSSMDASFETEGSTSLVNTTPSMMAAIGVASSITKQVGISDVNSIGSNEKDHATKQELNEAIQAGDWTAVTATAALLAKTEIPMRTSLSETSVSSGMSGMSGSTLGQQSLDRASHFAKLVENGDWEGVMQAAAEFEGASDTSSLYDSKNTLDDTDSGGSPRSQEEKTGIRAEIEALIKDVVPDELDNIDEMMTQFRGREQELIDTLRTMQDQRAGTNESPNDLYASPGVASASQANIVFENDSITSPFWDDSSKTNSSLAKGSENEGSLSSKSQRSRS